MKTIPNLSNQEASKFWGCAEVTNDPNECWGWLAGKNLRGYGQFSLLRNSKWDIFGAHRISYWIFNGVQPGTLFVCHSCDNPSCVNPRHLFLGTNSDNLLDASAKGRIASGDRNGARSIPDRLIRGEAVNTAKLSTDDVLEIRHLRSARLETNASLAKRFGVSANQIYRIVSRKCWKHV